MRRATDATKLTFSTPVVAAIIVWVLSLAAAWYGVQTRLGEIQSDVRVIGERLENQNETSIVKQQQWEARIKESELTIKSHDIRIRQLETDFARLGRRP